MLLAFPSRVQGLLSTSCALYWLSPSSSDTCPVSALKALKQTSHDPQSHLSFSPLPFVHTSSPHLPYATAVAL